MAQVFPKNWTQTKIKKKKIETDFNGTFQLIK